MVVSPFSCSISLTVVSLGQAKRSVQTVKRVPEQFSWGVPKGISGASGVPSLARGTNAAAISLLGGRGSMTWRLGGLGGV